MEGWEGGGVSEGVGGLVLMVCEVGRFETTGSSSGGFVT